MLVGAATGSFSSPIGSMYVQKHFKEEAKEAMDEMVKDIRAEFHTILDEIDWMDEKTRVRAKVRYNVDYVWTITISNRNNEALLL